MVKALDESDVKLLELYDDQYFSLLHRYGEIAYAQHVLEREKSSIEKSLQDIEANLNVLSNTLQQKYGSGSIDLESKTFKSNE